MGRRAPDWNEDGCLCLNVWTPRLPGAPSGRGLPVLVWFHGGGFTSGSRGWDWYDGRNLAAAGDIVVVTANYCIGPLGYLYLPELGIENLGGQDQAAVLAGVADMCSVSLENQNIPPATRAEPARIIYAEQARRYPGFAEYERQTAGIRTIPVLGLTLA